jgi:hypothetical protein
METHDGFADSTAPSLSDFSLSELPPFRVVVSVKRCHQQQIRLRLELVYE